MADNNNHNEQGSALSVIQFARRVQVSENTARRMIREGAIRGHRIGRQWRVFEVDLQVYLEAVSNVARYGAAAIDPREAQAAAYVLAHDVPRGLEAGGRPSYEPGRGAESRRRR